VKYLIINIKQGHHPQQEHRQSHLDTQQIIEDIHRLASQPVLDSEYLHSIGHRMTN